MNKAILSVSQLKKLFPIKQGLLGKSKEYVHALDEVDLDIFPCTTFGLLGESGCGKSTFAKTVTKLIESSSGSINFNGEEISEMTQEEFRRRKLHCQMQIVFQNPAEVLSPRKLVDFLINEPMKINKIYKTDREINERTKELLDKVNLRQELLQRYPHQLSGGQQQRICIARALSLNSTFIVLDEPTSALDVSVQAKILNLLVKLQQDESLTYLLITHDLRVAEYICTDIAVMYLGEVVEIHSAESFRKEAKHPYSKLLVRSSLSEYEIDDIELKHSGELPSSIHLPRGCRFSSRCPESMPICSEEHPKLIKLKDGGMCRCHKVQ